MERQDRLTAIEGIIIDTMVENYRQYGTMNNMSLEDVDKLISDNVQGVNHMAHLVSERIDAKLFP
jgi:hypothetical protein